MRILKATFAGLLLPVGAFSTENPGVGLYRADLSGAFPERADGAISP